MSKLTFATGRRYDTKFLLDGQVRVNGFDIEYIDTGSVPWPAFRAMVTTLPYDIAEQAFSHYLIALDSGKPLTAIPVFPSRFFPQLGATVNRSAGISQPSDLAGKRVATLGFGYNPAVWLRGILSHQYDVSTERIIWLEEKSDPFLGGLDYHKSSRFVIQQVEGLMSSLSGGNIQPIDILERGEVDAFFPPSAGPPLTEHTAKLFPDPMVAIRHYVRATGVFPINTVVTLKQDVVKAHPDLPKCLFEASVKARELYHEEVNQGKERVHMGLDAAELRAMGLFPDRYGIDPNRSAIRMMIHYCYAQGLISKLYEPEEIFAATA
jgi:4,5-dihydroxyphthalate decarboxylase